MCHRDDGEEALVREAGQGLQVFNYSVFIQTCVHLDVLFTSTYGQLRDRRWLLTEEHVLRDMI